ncbi:hypothetical protein BJ508DRAFT_418967 [Ascobolus immersus RN42]|uniref:MACPF-like domain-containing protein n=1 Tax=Ascobolus immersus RN42 TaxID=1160509 RepID=A0A3N4HI24_ASCIM|nr:hypothetical protein BJ508DRAFT_418967 [Ascobolus immersus RN42]
MAAQRFHISVDGPDTSYASFPSDKLSKGDPQKILLSMIRRECAISPKLWFTADGKSRISDDTTLQYYMSLTTEGQQILSSLTSPSSSSPPSAEEEDNNDTPAGSDDGNPEPSVSAADTNNSGGSSAQSTGIKTLTITVTDGKTDRSPKKPLDLPGENAALRKLLEGIAKGPGLVTGTLPTFTDRLLRSLKEDYSVKAGTGNHPEPIELTEQQWDAVLRNNRAFHGYWYDWNKNILVKARKPAFKLKGARPVGTETSTGNKPVVPPVPPFYICDDASVDVHEIRSQFQHTLAKEGFNSTAVGGSIGGGSASVPATINASWEQESAYANQDKTSIKVESIVTTYNFPRVTIDLECEDLELTDECKKDIERLVASKDSTWKERFERMYGTIFATKFTLGGFLHSTQHIDEKEKSKLDQIKNQSRIAAGVSIQSPKASGSLNFAKVKSDTESDGKATLYQEARLTWDARGGDTLLTSNPALWAGTVKNYRLWRLMNQERLVRVKDLVRTIAPALFENLDNPSSKKPGSSDVIKDEAAQEKARRVIQRAIKDWKTTGQSTIIKAMEDYYEQEQFYLEGKIAPYNDFCRENLPGEEDALIPPATKFRATDDDQKTGLGLYMGSKGLLELV